MRPKIHILYLLFIAFSISCKKENSKPRWDTLTVKEKVTSGSISNLILTRDNEIIVRVNYTGHEDFSTFYHSTDNGIRWESMDLLNVATTGYSRIRLYDFYNSETNTIYLTSPGGGIMGFDPGILLKINLTTQVSLFLNRPIGETGYPAPPVDFLNDSLGFLALSDYNLTGYLCRTTNAGDSWDTVLTDTRIYSISFADENTGFVSTENTCWKTINQGDSWEKVFETSSIIRKVSMSNSNIGVLGGDKIWLTIDGGASWEIIYDNPVKDVKMDYKSNIYVISKNGKFFYSENLGESWSAKSKKGEGFSILEIFDNNVLTSISNGNYSDNNGRKMDIRIGRLKN